MRNGLCYNLLLIGINSQEPGDKLAEKTKRPRAASHATQRLWEGAQHCNPWFLTSPVNTTDWEILLLAFYGAYKSKSSVSTKYCPQLLEGTSFSPALAAVRLTACHGQGCRSDQACFTMPGRLVPRCDTDRGTAVIFYEAFFMSPQRQVPTARRGEVRTAAVVQSRVQPAQCRLFSGGCRHVGKSKEETSTYDAFPNAQPTWFIGSTEVEQNRIPV